MNTIMVNMSLREAVSHINSAVIDGSITGEKIDEYYINDNAVVLVYEKHYYRAGNRLTLTVVIDDFENFTRVHYVGGGGGQGLFKFDWGASESFGDVVRKAFERYII